jgi:hypothetical protein
MMAAIESIWDNSFACFLAVMLALSIIAGWGFCILRIGIWFVNKYGD